MSRTDSDGGLPPLAAGLRWRVYRDNRNDLCIALQKEKFFWGMFPRWADLYDERITSSYDYFSPDKNLTVEELKAKTLRVAQDILARYNKAQQSAAAKRQVEELFKEVT